MNLNKRSGAVYSVGYNAWKGGDGLSRMFDALESEGVTILVDTRNSDYRGRYSYDQLAQTAKARQGVDGKPMRFAARPALAGKPREEGEYTETGQADYRVMNTRPDAKRMLDGMAAAAVKGERIALLCACADTCTCHRTRWLARSLSRRGVDVGHIEPGEFDYERHQEEGARELYRITRQSDLPELPPHSDTYWRERAESWSKHPEPKPAPQDYHSPRPTRAMPERPAQVLIAGSMNANPAQLNYASDLVVRAAEIGAQIHVGDNEQGVDARVAATAEAIGYENVVVWTAGDAPRNGGVSGGQIRKVPYNYKEKGNRFTQRDQTMIRALDDQDGAAFFIDNGFAHRKSGTLTGTEAGYVFAAAQGKAARKVSFGRQRDRATELKSLPTSYTPEHESEAPAAQPAEEVSADAPATQRYMSLGEFEADLRQRMGLPAAPPASEPDVLELPDDREHTLATQNERWQAALETAEQQEAQRQRLPYLSGRPGYKTASLIDVQALPVADLDGTSLGYTAAAVEVAWRSSPFKIKIDEWRDADTVIVTELAHFKQQDQAQGYVENLRGFMDEHRVTDSIDQERDFLREVGRQNGLRPATYTTHLIEMGVSRIPDYRDKVQALQSGDWTLKTMEIGFRPMAEEREISNSDPDPRYGFSIHAVQTTDPAGQHLGYSAVALRDVYAKELSVESDIRESYALELARFEKQDDAQQYAEALTQYIQEKPELALAETPQNTGSIHNFLEKIALEQGLQLAEQRCDRGQLLEQKLFQSQQEVVVPAAQLSPQLADSIDLDH